MATPWMIVRPGSKVGMTTTDPGPLSGIIFGTAFADGDFTCQITSAMLTPTASTETQDLPGTFCEPAQSIPLAGASTWTVDISLIQDANDPDGLQEFLFTNDGLEGWIYCSTSAADEAPKFLAHVYLSASAIGGAPATPLTADVSFRALEKPEYEFGTGGVAMAASAPEPETVGV